MKWIFIFPAIILSFAASGQKELLNRQVESKEEAIKGGPNSEYFSYFYLDLGFMADYMTNSENRLEATSHMAHIGFRQKFKVVKRASVLVDVAFRRSSIRPKSDYFIKGLGDFERHGEQRLIQAGVYGGFFCRLNFGKQGNHLGTYLDIGIYGVSHLYSRLRQESEPDRDKDNVTVFHWQKNNSAFKPFLYGVKVRSGYDWISLWASYRLTDIFEKDNTQQVDYYNFAPITIGVEVKLF